jgi:7-carboxy-7-deazaguanine synthase
MTYSVKEIFYTLQGEGFHAGRPAVFCRFAGCNLWSGREADRAAAVCQFCDTDFVGVDGQGGGRFDDAESLAQAVSGYWPKLQPQGTGNRKPLVVLTGGEPLLQLDASLIDALHRQGFEIAVETNGTISAPQGIDWLCVSPKAGAELQQRSGHELKVVYPQPGLDFQALASLDFQHFRIQPMDGPLIRDNTQRAVDFCLQNPRWSLSLQTHKALGIR